MASLSKKKPTVHNTNCCVYGCHSRKGTDRKIHFHSFPPKDSGIRVKIKNGTGQEEEMDKREAWEKVLQRVKPATKYIRVCSKHFTADDYLSRGVELKQPKLRRWAVPSQNLPEKHQIFENSRAGPSNPSLKCLCKSHQILGVKPSETSESDHDEEQSLPLQSRNYYNELSENERVALNSLMKFDGSDKDLFLFKFDAESKYFVDGKIMNT